jgi:hypothetical protein
MVFVKVLYPGYHRLPIMAQESGYYRFPPTTHGLGTKHPIPDTVPPLLAEEEGPPI